MLIQCLVASTTESGTGLELVMLWGGGREYFISCKLMILNVFT